MDEHEDNSTKSKGSNRHKRLTLILAFAGVFLVAMGVTAFLHLRDHEEPLATFQDESSGLSFQHDSMLTKQTITDEDKKDNVFLRMTEPKGSKDALLVTARYEKGLKTITSVTRQDLRTALNDSIDKSFPKRYPEYKQVERKDIEVAGNQATQVTFTYKGKNGEAVKQRFLMIIKDNDTAVYLAAQGKDKDFAALEQQYFNIIFSTAHVQ